MRFRCFVGSALICLLGSAYGATPGCEFQLKQRGGQQLGQWIGPNNWLAVENQRLTLDKPDTFMPAGVLGPLGKGIGTTNSASIDDFPAIDPLDGSQRPLGFLLDSRLFADGLLVMVNGRISVERYRNGLAPDRVRLLFETTRPLLNLLAAMSLAQGKLAADKSVVRYVPELSDSSGLRKMSVQRLLENRETYAWQPEDMAAWQTAAGWDGSAASPGIRAWLAESGRWNRALTERGKSLPAGGPEDDLLAWLLAESQGMKLSRLFCEQILGRIKREGPVLWLTDPKGEDIASGLALTLRDFARVGQLLVDVRYGRNRAKVPAWFLETLLASSTVRSVEIPGLGKGSELRYGFVHLGGAPNRVALLGRHGTSLYVDFDKRLVIALFATRPGGNTPGTLALLEQAWHAVDLAAAGVGTKPRR